MSFLGKMNRDKNISGLLFLILCMVVYLGCTETGGGQAFPVLKGPYLGQKPPGMTPEIFAPGIISTEKNEINSVFSPDGKEFFFARRNGNKLLMYFSREINGIWTKPQAFPYFEGTFNGDMNYSPDGKRLYYCSNRKTDASLGDLDIWYSECTETGWCEPVNLGPPVNSSSSETYPVFTQNEGLYFGSNREGTRGDKDVYYSRFIDGKYIQPISMGDAINSDYGEGDTYVAFDESFMVINSWGRPDGYGRGDLYVSFRLADGTRSKAKNMGERINTEYLEFCPMLSPDGKYLFFTSHRRGNGDIYWVDAKVIEELKPDGLKQKEIPFRADRLSERVLFIKSGKSAIMSNSTAVATSRGLVIIDAHYKPECGQNIRRIVERDFGRDDFAYLIYTHAGVDHMGGASAFPEALVVGHDNCITCINGLGDRLKSVDIREILNPRIELLKAKIRVGSSDEAEKIKLDEALFYWSELGEILAAGFEYRQPTITFNEDLDLHLGDVTIKLRYCTPGYSESDILIHIPEEKLLVVGDIFNRDRIPLLNEKSDVKRWLDLFEPFVKEKEEVRNIIGGHDEMISLDELKAQYQYLSDLWEGVVVAKKEGLTLEKVKEDYAFNKQFSHLSHLNIRWISTPDNLHERNIEYIWKITEQQKEDKT